MFKSGVKAPNDWVVSWPGRSARSPSTTTGSAQCCKLCKTKNRGGLAGGKQRGKQGRKQGRETNEVARTHGTRPRRPPSNSRALYCNRAPQVSSQRQIIPVGAPVSHKPGITVIKMLNESLFHAHNSCLIHGIYIFDSAQANLCTTILK